MNDLSPVARGQDRAATETTHSATNPPTPVVSPAPGGDGTELETEREDMPKKKNAETEAAELTEARSILKELGLDRLVGELPDEAKIKLAKKLSASREIDRETGLIVEQLKSAADRVSRAKLTEADAKEAHKDAKSRLDSALSEEHEAALRLRSVTEPGYQKTLPLKPAEPEKKPVELTEFQRSVLERIKTDCENKTGSSLIELAEALTPPEGESMDAALEALLAAGMAERFAAGGGDLLYRPMPEAAPAGDAAPEIPAELLAEAREIVASMRRHKDGSKVVKTKGLGSSSLAKRLFGESKKDLKQRAAQILGLLEAEGAVLRVDGANKEPSFYPADPAEQGEKKSADTF